VADHPVKVPAELVASLRNSAPHHGIRDAGVTRELWLINSAYAAGADQELEACCKWLRSKDILEPAIDALRSVRRPKPPSLAERALEQYERVEDILLNHDVIPAGCIRTALTRLAELEAQQ
jgi:hypothetical protein